jgi:hypothetical protein
MKRRTLFLALAAFLLAAVTASVWYRRLPSTGPPCPCSGVLTDYPWPHAAPTYQSVASRFPPPRGMRCVELAPGSWGAWLRGLPMQPPASPLRIYAGMAYPAVVTPWIAGIVDLDLRHGQDCSKTVLRLRLEYLRQAGRATEISVPTGEGDPLTWTQWARGWRPHPHGSRILVSAGGAPPDDSRASFDRFLGCVRLWCGTYQLEQDGRPVAPGDIQVGDFFVRPGAPGHTVLVTDLARDRRGRLYALILQGALPAQSAQILRPRPGQVWFLLDPTQPVVLPGCKPFPWNTLRRFR